MLNWLKTLGAAFSGNASINEDINIVGELATGMNFGEQAGLALKNAEQLIEQGEGKIKSGEKQFAKAQDTFTRIVQRHAPVRDRRQTEASHTIQDGRKDKRRGAIGVVAAKRMLGIK